MELSFQQTTLHYMLPTVVDAGVCEGFDRRVDFHLMGRNLAKKRPSTERFNVWEPMSGVSESGVEGNLRSVFCSSVDGGREKTVVSLSMLCQDEEDRRSWARKVAQRSNLLRGTHSVGVDAVKTPDLKPTHAMAPMASRGCPYRKETGGCIVDKGHVPLQGQQGSCMDKRKGNGRVASMGVLLPVPCRNGPRTWTARRRGPSTIPHPFFCPRSRAWQPLCLSEGTAFQLYPDNWAQCS
ncbi:hypothetical protein B0T13DRAFT_449933 [Neurospora crassa]|nr:hypothetical protein B0T13DRAFT_449933 [Neurospora crassa]